MKHLYIYIFTSLLASPVLGSEIYHCQEQDPKYRDTFLLNVSEKMIRVVDSLSTPYISMDFDFEAGQDDVTIYVIKRNDEIYGALTSVEGDINATLDYAIYNVFGNPKPLHQWLYLQCERLPTPVLTP
jgi:hypothetical protein